MSMDLVAQFADSALETVDSCTRTNVAEFEEALAERLVEPAIGAPLTLESVTLEDTAVDTDPSVEDFRTAQTGVARAEVGLANYGTISIESRAGGDELVSLYPPRHVVVLDAAEAFDRFESAIRDARESGGPGASRVLATGPSATADMGELVEGVHGPKEVHVLVVEQ